MFWFNVKLGVLVAGSMAVGAALTEEEFPFKPHVGYAIHCVEDAARMTAPGRMGLGCRAAAKLAVWTEGEDAMKRYTAEIILRRFAEELPGAIARSATR